MHKPLGLCTFFASKASIMHLCVFSRKRPVLCNDFWDYFLYTHKCTHFWGLFTNARDLDEKILLDISPFSCYNVYRR